MKQKFEIIIKTCHSMITEYKSEWKILDTVLTFWLIGYVFEQNTMWYGIKLAGKFKSPMENIADILNNFFYELSFPEKSFIIPVYYIILLNIIFLIFLPFLTPLPSFWHSYAKKVSDDINKNSSS